MPTNDERREVAARLRYFGRMNFLSNVDPKRVLLDVTTGGGDTAWQSIYDCLADLIEPEPELTCEYIGDKISGGCSACRGWLDPACAYCPSCGAKVVR